MEGGCMQLCLASVFFLSLNRTQQHQYVNTQEVLYHLIKQKQVTLDALDNF